MGQRLELGTGKYIGAQPAWKRSYRKKMTILEVSAAIPSHKAESFAEAYDGSLRPNGSVPRRVWAAHSDYPMWILGLIWNI